MHVCIYIFIVLVAIIWAFLKLLQTCDSKFICANYNFIFIHCKKWLAIL